MDLTELKKKIPGIFKKVKADVQRVINRHRAGLRCGFGAMGITRENIIGGVLLRDSMLILNEDPFYIMFKELSEDIILAYAYFLLLHLYMYSLDFLSGVQCREMVTRIIKTVHKEDPAHPAVVIATEGVEAYVPDLKLTSIPPPIPKLEALQIEWIDRFDKKSYRYSS